MDAFLGHAAAGRLDALVEAVLVLDDALRRGWDERSLAWVVEQHGKLGYLPSTRVLAVAQRWPAGEDEADQPEPVAAVIDLTAERVRRRRPADYSPTRPTTLTS
ncbi:MAG: hypothetical protein NVV66_16460 [Cellulomonas sp.]|uniref:hypothetical protein n=1 Tax=Cellulomonas sp. TaxID=40001 RepID=UPI00258CF94E|nr:hypothetical protein [Cellulomonas sp.]MCR6706208.1 hypothetical protein [Cellulomonas sp.]